MKTVIFVGGTSFSGSTLFCLTLANDPRGFATGEVQHLFHPGAPHHANFADKCGCGDPNCRIWHDVKAVGDKRLFAKLFDMFPDLEFIVDSSKNPLWIEYQTKLLRQQGIAVKNIMMWKTPQELAKSYDKRGKFDQWEKVWTTYHRLYHSLIDEPWGALPYKEYATDESALERVCNFLDIPFFPDKKEYWNKTHHVLGGNHSARIHLYSPSSKQYQYAESKLPDRKEQAVPDIHKQVYYRSEADEAFQTAVSQQVSQSDYIAPILDMLHAHHIDQPSVASGWSELKLPWLNLQARWLQQKYKFTRGHLKFG